MHRNEEQMYLRKYLDTVTFLENSKIRVKFSGISSDAYHISSPDPSGIGAQLSMQRAIEDAKLKSEDVRILNK